MVSPFRGLTPPYGVLRAIRNAGLALILAVGVAEAEPVTVAALGDSLTQGFGLPPDDGFVPRLQAWLDGQGADVRMINAGVSGDTTAGGLSRIEWTLTPDVDALIVALGGNDLLRGIDPAASRANISGMLQVAEARGLPVLLVGVEAPSNYGAEYKAAFDAMYLELAEEFGALYHENFLGALLDGNDRQTALAELMQGDAIHPNAAGVALIVSDIGPRVVELVAVARAGE